jgi:hypothetical protein
MIGAKRALLFDIRESAAVTGIDRQSLANMVAAGVIRPALWGRKGPTLGHRFSPAQLLGLAVVGALRDSPRRAGTAYQKEVLTYFEGLDPGSLAWWLEVRTDEGAREAAAASFTSPDATRIFGDRGRPRLDSDARTAEDVLARIDRVAEAVARRCGLADPAPGRMGGTPGGVKGKRT